MEVSGEEPTFLNNKHIYSNSIFVSLTMDIG